jgi:hypothetical protein
VFLFAEHHEQVKNACDQYQWTRDVIEVHSIEDMPEQLRKVKNAYGKILIQKVAVDKGSCT